MIGIRAIEEVVQTLSAQPRPTVDASDAEFLRQFLSEEQLLELWLRNCAAMVFEEVLGGSLAPSDLQELKRSCFKKCIAFHSVLGHELRNKILAVGYMTGMFSGVESGFSPWIIILISLLINNEHHVDNRGMPVQSITIFLL